jgi:hypothetical protein
MTADEAVSIWVIGGNDHFLVLAADIHLGFPESDGFVHVSGPDDDTRVGECVATAPLSKNRA